MKYHQPVLLNEVIAGLKVRPGGKYIDMTVGGGGHTAAILDKGGIVLGIDRDPDAIEWAKNRFDEDIKAGRLILMKSNFDHVSEIATSSLDRLGTPRNDSEGLFDGILFDLGMSSHQIDASGRGFSFQKNEPLDMRMDPELTVTAADLVNALGKKELVHLFIKFGQVEKAATVAEAILAKRKSGNISTTGELAEIVEKVIPRRGMLHPATKVFMSLRMAVNDELDSLDRALQQAVQLLAVGGRLAVISFHAGEDRIVKHFMNEEPGIEMLTKKPIEAGEDEVETNPRSRSGRLRVGVRINHD